MDPQVVEETLTEMKSAIRELRARIEELELRLGAVERTSVPALPFVGSGSAARPQGPAPQSRIAIPPVDTDLTGIESITLKFDDAFSTEPSEAVPTDTQEFAADVYQLDEIPDAERADISTLKIDGFIEPKDPT